MTSPHATNYVDAHRHLVESGLFDRHARQLVLITGATYAPAVYHFVERCQKRKTGELISALGRINPDKLLTVAQLNRELRRACLGVLPLAKIPASARIVSRVYNGLRFLAQLEPFPGGS